jgi:hypothetical protein
MRFIEQKTIFTFEERRIESKHYQGIPENLRVEGSSFFFRSCPPF